MSSDQTKTDGSPSHNQQASDPSSAEPTASRSIEDLSNRELKAELQSMDDYDFEHLVADLWERQGWKTTVLQQSNDRGVDVVAEKDDLIHQKWLIQAKRYKKGNNLGGPDIREYIGLKMRKDVDEVLVISTADFTRSAYQEQDDNNINLINGDQLVDLINDLEAYDAVDQYIALPEPKPSDSASTSTSARTSTDNSEVKSQHSSQLNSSKSIPSESSSASPSWSDTMPELTRGTGQVCDGGKQVINHLDEAASSHGDVLNSLDGEFKTTREFFRVLPEGAEAIIVNDSKTTDELAAAGESYIRFMQSPPRTWGEIALWAGMVMWVVASFSSLVVFAQSTPIGLFHLLAWLITPIAIWRDWKVASKYVPDWGLGKHKRQTKGMYILGSYFLSFFGPVAAGVYLLRRWQLGSKEPSTYGHAKMFQKLIRTDIVDND